MKHLIAACLLMVCTPVNAGEIHDLYLKSGGLPYDMVPTDPSRGAITDHGITEIGIERTVCFFACPDYTFIARSDGTFRYLGRDHVDHIGLRTGTIPVAEFNGLAQFIKESGYMELSGRYVGGFTDQPTTYSMVIMDGQRKIIMNYGNAGPTKLWAIEELIDHLRDQATWN